MKHLVLYITLLFAFTIDHFYLIGQVKAHKDVQSDELTEAYMVVDKLALMYLKERSKVKKLKYERDILRDANEQLIKHSTPSSVNRAIKATPLPPMKG